MTPHAITYFEPFYPLLANTLVKCKLMAHPSGTTKTLPELPNAGPLEALDEKAVHVTDVPLSASEIWEGERYTLLQEQWMRGCVMLSHTSYPSQQTNQPGSPGAPAPQPGLSLGSLVHCTVRTATDHWCLASTTILISDVPPTKTLAKISYFLPLVCSICGHSRWSLRLPPHPQILESKSLPDIIIN